MSIKIKTLMIYLMGGLVSIIFVSLVFRLAITNYVNSLEEKDVKASFEIVNAIMTREESNLTKSVMDWSHWDDTYNFMKGKSKSEYVQNNLQEATLKQLKLNIMLFVDSKNSKYYSITDGVDKVSENLFVKKLLYKSVSYKGISSFIGNNEVHFGMLPSSGKLFMIVASPITMTDSKSGSNGTLILGRYIDKELLEYISGLTKDDIRIDEVTAQDKRFSVIEIKRAGDYIDASEKLKDIQGNMSILTTIHMERTDRNTSELYLRILNIMLALMVLVITIVESFVSDRYLLGRLKALYQFIEQVGKTKDVKARIALNGNDEITKIGEATNNMLYALDMAYSDIKKMDERFKIIMGATNDGYIDYNAETKEFYISPEWKNFIGFNESNTDFDLFVEYISRIHPDSIKNFKENFDNLMNGEADYFEDEYKIVRESGEIVWVFHRLKIAERDIDGKVIRLVGTLLDITARKNYEEEIINLSYSDKLTGLKNRAFVERNLEKLDKSGAEYSIIMGDVNGLKLMNDTFGHREGDRYICAIADILKKSCSQEDIIARWGGDEFIILAIEKEKGYTTKVSERIRNECNRNADFGFKVSIAIGSANKKEMHNAEAVMNLAEERMYRGKLTEIRSSRNATIMSLENTLYEKHSETEEHTQRIKKLSVTLGKELGLSDDELNELELLSILHDIGKIGIPESILMKPGKLTEEEWETMKRHTEIGYRIAKATAGLSHVAEEILSHHEKYDGTGYPRGLKGEQIPILSRIINIVDSFDVMTHSRTYKDASSMDYAIGELKRCSGTQFDPQIVIKFLELLEVGRKKSQN